MHTLFEYVHGFYPHVKDQNHHWNEYVRVRSHFKLLQECIRRRIYVYIKGNRYMCTIYIYMYTALKWSSLELFWQFYQLLFLCLEIH